MVVLHFMSLLWLSSSSLGISLTSWPSFLELSRLVGLPLISLSFKHRVSLPHQVRPLPTRITTQMVLVL
jgi:hypothetical protein